MFWILSLLFFGLTLLVTGWDKTFLPGAGGKVARNAPFAISIFFIVISQLGMFVAAAFVANAVNRDHALKADSLFFSSPVNRHGYLAGRFLGSLLPAIVIVAFAALAHMLGSIGPLHPPEKLVPISLAPYAAALVVFVIPNFFVMGALAFALATLTRRVLNAYIGLIVVFVLLFLAQSALSDLDYRTTLALVDPFGGTAWGIVTNYWTVAEKNHQVVWFDGYLLLNRAIWIGVGVGLLALTHARFRMQIAGGRRRRKPPAEEVKPELVASNTPIPKATLDFSRRAHLAQLLSQTWLELRWVTRRIGFTVLVGFGMFNVLGALYLGSRQAYATPIWPVTRFVLETVNGGFTIFLLAIVTVYAGQMVWREREAKMGQIFDATPIPSWVPLTSKILALMLAVVALLFAGMFAGVSYQIASGFMEIELGLFIKGLLLIQFPGWAELVVLAFAVQVLINNKYLGFGAMVLYYLSLAILPNVGVEHNLLLLGQTPPTPYSDMNQYGHFLTPFFWFNLYWLCAIAILGLISSLFWVRGTDTSFRLRAREARRRVTPAHSLFLMTMVTCFIGSGAYIYYNTNVLNTYKTSDQQEEERVEFERKYKQYESTPKPRLTAIKLDVDIYPDQRYVHAKGQMTLVNQTDAPIPELHIILDPEIELLSFSVPESARTLHDETLGFSIYTLPEPLAPGASMLLEFEAKRVNRGFTNGRGNINVVHNGTFFHGGEIVPNIGYNRAFEISDLEKRREHGLPERPRMLPIDDMNARMNTYISNEADWIDFEATVSTVSDQIAIAPGYLQKEWSKDGRRYFHYKMDAPILNLYGFLSARFTVVRDQWNDVSIEVYHHAPHAYNVEKMITSVKESLDYFTKNFSPYQHRQVRIIEFPRYRTFAQSLPNTIPYSEGIGFIANLVDPDDIDYVYYVTAHEIAHQWWAHQVIGGDVQGSTLLVESMAQYSALMVMEQKYGRDKMKRFLRHELDSYLRARGGERIMENPLMLNENQQYIHYNKGSVVLYALREYIGEDELNAALAKFIEAHKFQRPPFTTAAEFVDALEAATPADRKYIIDDWFRNITLYDNKVTSARAQATEGGRYKVTLEIESRKLRSDGLGEEKEVPLHEGGELVELGVLGPDDEDGEETVLYRGFHRLHERVSTVELEVEGEPKKAGVDPMVLLIDRNPEDNVRPVELSQ